MKRLMQRFCGAFFLWLAMTGAPLAATVIEVGEAVDGAIEVVGETDEYTFTAAAGDTLYFDVQDGARYGIRWELLGPDGAQVFSTYSWLDEGPVELAATGAYTLRITGRGSDTSAYRFQIFQVPPPTLTAIAAGRLVHGELSVPGQYDAFTFTAEAGRTLSLEVVSGAISGLQWRLYGPDERLVGSALSWYGVSTFEIPTSGVHRLEVDGRVDFTGRFAFRLWEVRDDQDRVIALDAPVTGALLTPGEQQSYRFDAAAGQDIAFDLHFNPGRATAFTLYAPDGTILFRNVVVSQTLTDLPQDGTYRLVARAWRTLGDRFSFQIASSATPSPFPAAADLEVTSVSAPRRVVGDPAAVEVTWTVTNIGTVPTDADAWVDRVVFRSDRDFELRAVLGLPSVEDRVVESVRATVAHSGTLAPGEHYTRTAVIPIEPGYQGAFEVAVIADADNVVFESQNEDNSAAAGHLTAVYPAPRTLSGEGAIRLDLEDGSRLPAGVTFNLGGLANLGGGAVNVVAIIDISWSTTNRGGGLDANGDGVADDRDDLNGDGIAGSILDVEIGALLAIAEQLGERGDDVLITVVPFDKVAANLDLGPGLHTQLFQRPDAHAEAHLATPDLESAVRNLRVLTPIGTNFQDAILKAGRALDSAPPADQTLVFFFTDGEAVTQPTAEEIDAFAAYGIRFHAYQIGNPQVTPSLQALVQGIDAHPASSASGASIENPEELAPVVLDALRLTAVEINGQPVTALDARGAFFAPVTLAEGPNALEIRAIDTAGNAVVRRITLHGVAGGVPAEARDVTGEGVLHYANTRYNRATGRLHVEARLANTGPFPMRSPVEAALDVRPAAVTLDNAEGRTPEGLPLVRFDDELGADGLAPAALSGALALQFGNRREARFAVSALLSAYGNRAPLFTSIPVTRIASGDAYAYTAAALDGDGDPLRYRLLEAPAGMTLDPVTGRLAWLSTRAGTHRVRLEADDGRGGGAVQEFVLTVTSGAPGDLAPLVLSSPPTTAVDGTPYTYPVQALDPEGQPLIFSLTGGPAGMAIDAATGVIRFDPAAGDLGAYPVEVRVTDPAGNVGHQAWTLIVRGANQPPAFVSTPVASAVIGATYRYRAQAVDDGDALVYSLRRAPAGMTIDPYSGSIRMHPEAAQAGAHEVVVRVEDALGAAAEQAYTLTVAADAEPPRVSALLERNPIRLGETVRVQVRAADNVEVDSIDLRVQDTPTALDGNGTAGITPPAAGLYRIVAGAIDVSGNRSEETVVLRVIDPADDEAPQPVIVSPASGALAGEPVAIVGTVSAPDLEFWRLEYARMDKVDINNVTADDPDWRLLASGEAAVDNAVLGTFDTTLLTDDAWVVRLVAGDHNGNVGSDSILLEVSAPTKLGQFALRYTDLDIPLAGIPVRIERRYNTLRAGDSGDFGYGWTLSFRQGNIRETVPVAANEAAAGLFVAHPYRYGTRVYIDTPDGRRAGFTFEPVAQPGLLGAVWHPRFVPDPGIPYELEVDDVGLSQKADGSFVLYLVGFNYNPRSFRLIARDGTVYHYDQFEGLSRVEDRYGNALTFTPGGVVHSSGLAITFERDAAGRITRILDPDGNALVYAYDARGDLVAVTDREGGTTRFAYLDDPAHYVREITDVRGNRVNLLEYDAEGRIAADIDALGNATRMDWNADAFTGTFTDARGNVHFKQYDAQGHVLSETDPLGNVRSYGYDADGNLVSVTDRNGRTTTMAYDARGNRIALTDPLGNTRQFRFDAFGRMIGVTAPTGDSASASVDASGNLTEVTLPDGSRALLDYDGQGRMTRLTDFSGNSIRFEYDGGLPLAGRIIRPDGSVRRIEYNRFGQPVRVVDENGAVTLREYDREGRLLAVQDPEGNRTRYEYDGDFVVRRIDPLGNVRLASYDANGRLTTLTRENGGVIRFEYDANGNLTRLTDPAGNVTRFVYDALDRLVERIDPLGASSTWEYDPEGNLIRYTDRNGRVREHDYDALDRVVTTRWIDETGMLVNTIRYSYDALGNRVGVSDDFSSLQFTYDAVRRLVAASNRGTPGAPEVTLTYVHDGNGRPLRIADDLGAVTESVYDGLGRLRARIWQGGGTEAGRAEFGYDARGGYTDIARFADAAGTRPVGRSLFTWDAAGRLTGLRHEDPVAQLVAEFRSLYDAASRLVSETHHGQTFGYRYDAEGQLVEAQRSRFGSEFFSYDLNGNRIDAGYVTGAGNRLLADGVHAYEYDAEGNMVRRTHLASGEEVRFVWDARNRLTGVLRFDGGGTLIEDIRYTYDALDRRIRVEINGQVLRHTVYDGMHAWADHDGAGNRTARYAFGDAIDQILARLEPGGQFWHLTDRLGTVHDLVDADGAVVNHVDYDSFGAVRAQSDAAAGDRYLFTGREWDAESGLYHYRARPYAPDIGRFLSEDPTGFEGGDANLYRYVGNSPQNAVDPTGESAVEYAQMVCLGLTGVRALLPVISCTERLFNAIAHSVTNLAGQGDLAYRWVECVWIEHAKGAGGARASLVKIDHDESGGFTAGPANDAIEKLDIGCNLLEATE